MPAAHVACDFTTNSLDEAMDHFEATSHCVDDTTSICVYGTDHGDCGLPANYAFTESDRTTYACSIHVRSVANNMLDYASDFCYRVLNP